ncbi:hypothetical protein L5F07_01170 [Aliarcobacter butzleri]|uniref:hypothetical protein n=1 Tax=Aliarcobacter butzleri TaxID=28197 RepID=UPI001EDC87B4|nr:hypothetical protein [Aliarcobacter butzleri]MCG3677857.1 hypothetical protein [Aliarcobacter butzleri]
MTQERETTSIKLDKTTKEKAKVIFEQHEETQKVMKDIVEGKNIQKLDLKELKR